MEQEEHVASHVVEQVVVEVLILQSGMIHVKASKSASKEVSTLETNESVDYVERLKQIKALLDDGIINQDDFEKMKQKIIDTIELIYYPSHIYSDFEGTGGGSLNSANY